MSDVIRFENIQKAFGPKVVLNGVTLQVGTGQILFIIGQSGVGKSVLVKHLVGLLRPDGGRVYLDDEDITDFTERQFFRVRKKCAMVFQNSTLFDSMTLLDNVALPIRKHKKVSDHKAREMAMDKLALVEMEGEAERYPADFGDGMRKKVAIARALTLDPEYVIFDEPTTGLDPLSALLVDGMIRDLSDRVGVTSIVVSHNLHSIFTITNQITILYKNKIQLDGTPPDFRHSDDPIVQQFIQGRPDGPMEV